MRNYLGLFAVAFFTISAGFLIMPWGFTNGEKPSGLLSWGNASNEQPNNNSESAKSGNYANIRRNKVVRYKPLKNSAWGDTYYFEPPPGYARSLDTPSLKGKDKIIASPDAKLIMLVNRVGDNFNGELFPIRDTQFALSIFGGEGFAKLYKQNVKASQIRNGVPVPKRVFWYPDSKNILIEMKHTKDFQEISLGGLAAQTVTDWSVAYSYHRFELETHQLEELIKPEYKRVQDQLEPERIIAILDDETFLYKHAGPNNFAGFTIGTVKLDGTKTKIAVLPERSGEIYYYYDDFQLRPKSNEVYYCRSASYNNRHEFFSLNLKNGAIANNTTKVPFQMHDAFSYLWNVKGNSIAFSHRDAGLEIAELKNGNFYSSVKFPPVEQIFDITSFTEYRVYFSGPPTEKRECTIEELDDVKYGSYSTPYFPPRSETDKDISQLLPA